MGLIVGLYLTRQDRLQQGIWGAALTFYQLPAPLAFLLTARYNGQRGRCGPAQRWLYYWFYPLHLLTLGLLARGLGL